MKVASNPEGVRDHEPLTGTDPLIPTVIVAPDHAPTDVPDLGPVTTPLTIVGGVAIGVSKVNANVVVLALATWMTAAVVTSAGEKDAPLDRRVPPVRVDAPGLPEDLRRRRRRERQGARLT